MNTQQEMIKALRDRVKSDKVASDICHVLATRQRARSEIYLRSLKRRMEKEGFTHDPQDYVSFLRFLGQLGIGTLQVSGNKLVALKNIHISLQSLGSAALGEVGFIKGWKPRNKYIHIERPKAIAKTPITPVKKPTPAANAPLIATKVVVGVKVNDKVVQIELPKGLTMQETLALISKLQGANNDKTQDDQVAFITL